MRTPRASTIGSVFVFAVLSAGCPGPATHDDAGSGSPADAGPVTSSSGPVSSSATAGGSSSGGVSSSTGSPSSSGPGVSSSTGGSSSAGACPAITFPRAFTVTTVHVGSGFIARAAVALGPDGRPRIAYNEATSEDGLSAYELRYAETSADGATVDADLLVVPSGTLSNEYPTVVVDAQGVAQVLYDRYVPGDGDSGHFDLFRVSGSSASGFGAPENLTNTPGDDELGPAAALAPDGTLHAVFMHRTPRPATPTNYDYRTAHLEVAPGIAPSTPTILAENTQIFFGHPDQSVAVADDGTVHALFLARGQAVGSSVVTLRSRTGDAWGAARGITLNTEDATGATVRTAPGGAVHLSYGVGGASAQTYYLGLAVDGRGAAHLTYRRLVGSNADVFYASIGADGVATSPQPVTTTPDLDEHHAAIAAGPCGEVYLVFAENLSTFEGDVPHGVLYLAVAR
jgi:hypothetical protein